MIIPFVDALHRVSLQIITMPIQSQGIITRERCPKPTGSINLDIREILDVTTTECRGDQDGCAGTYGMGGHNKTHSCRRDRGTPYDPSGNSKLTRESCSGSLLVRVAYDIRCRS